MSRPSSRRPRPSRRDRHGRGLRGRLVPAEVPLARTRAEQFDDLVLDAVEDIERRWERELAGVEFAVEDVPWVDHTSPDDVVLDPDVLDDGSIPLARVLPAHRENGREVPPRIVVYRRPLEIRAHDRDDLAELVRDVVVDQVAVLLGRDPDEIDPTGGPERLRGPAMLIAMEISAAAAGPWPVLGVVLGGLLLGLAGLGAALLHRRKHPATPGEPPRDDLDAFLEHPPGTPGGPRPPAEGWASLAPAAPPTRPDVAAPRARGVGVVLAAMAVAGLVLVATGAAVAVGTRAPAEHPAGTSAAVDPTEPGPAPGGIEARLSFGGVVLEPRAVGVTATYPELRLTGDADRPRAHLELPTWNCLAGEAPADPVAAGCVRSMPEFGDLAAPDLDVTRTAEGLRISGRFATLVRPNGSSPSETGRTYAVVVTVGTGDRATDGWLPAEGALQLGDDRARTTGTDAGAGVNVLRYGDR